MSLAIQRPSNRILTLGDLGGLQVKQRRSAGATYIDKVLSYSPIAYWPLNETSGIVAQCLVNSPAQDAAYVGPTLGQPGIGDGSTAPFFDGINDYVNAYSVAFRDAVDESQYTITGWAKVFNVGVWTDGLWRNTLDFRADGNNAIGVRKTNGNNQFNYHHYASGVFKQKTAACSSVAWFHFAAIGDTTGANGLTLFLDGVEQLPWVPSLGAWAGAFAATTTTIGSYQTTPQREWYGWLAHSAWFNGVLSDAAILDLATV